MYLCSVCVSPCLSCNIFECPTCSYKSCKKCCKNYFFSLVENNKNTCCMNCLTDINKYDLIKLFGIKWVFGKFFKYKNELLYKNQIHLLESTKGDADKNKKEDFIKRKKKMLLMKRRIINKEIKYLNAELIQHRRLFFDNNNIVIRRFMCSSCEGFLDESYKCNICYKYTCEKCYNIKNEDHICSDSSMNILNISKDCPNCGEFITKDDGCNIVKCIKCNITFDWNTRDIISNNNINTSIGIGKFDMPKLIDYNKLNISSYSDENIITIRGIYQHINEFIRFKLKNFINMLNVNNTEKLKKYRIDYINNNITKIQLYQKIIKIYKFENYRQYIIYIILFAYKKAIDIFNKGFDYLNELNVIINDTNSDIINITKYLKYTNNIKILHWFNINDIDKLIN